MEQRIVDDQRAVLGPHIVGEALTARATVGENGIVTGWNDGAEHLLGYAAEEILGRPAASLLAEEPPPRDLPPFAQLPRWHGTLALRHRDGRRIESGVLAHHHTTPEQGGGEWLVFSPLSGQEPDPADETLVRWSFTQSPCCAQALYDTRLRLRRANEDMQRAVALTEAEMRGLRVTEIVDNEAGERAEQAMARVLETGDPQYDENYLRATGETHEHAWSVFMAPLRDQEGRIQGVSLSAHDMTEQHWARKRLQLMTEAGRRIGTTLDVTRTAQELADVAVPELADFISVDLLASLDEPYEQPPAAAGSLTLRRIAHQSVYPGVPEAAVALGEVDEYPEGSPPVESLRSGRAVLHAVTAPAITEWIVQRPVRASRVRDFGIHSVMTVPLSARGTTLGVAVFLRHRHPDAFQQDDLVLAEELASRAAVCIDNARRYTRERGTAVTLQRSLLPQSMPEQAAVDVASRYLPAGAQAGVGGDWFDVIPLSGARVALVVGDVVGHGVHASATMGRLRTAVRTLADIDLPPDELLTHLDDMVGRLSTEAERAEWAARDGGASGDVGATCLYAVYDPVSRRCTLARAGHPPPAVVSPDGTVELLDLPVGPPLGLGGLPFEAAEVELLEGSLLALYTNGLVESRDDGAGQDIDDGIARLRRALASPAASLDILCDAVLASVLPQRPSDDVALLVARTRGLDTDRVASWDVAPEPAAVAEARKNAVAQLEAWGLTEAVFVTELVVSELVTNAIRHAEAPIQLRLIHDRSLICEVSDGSSTAPHMRRARTFDEGGRGLLLVAQLTNRWGTRPTPKGKTIWAEQNAE
ncbi:SpoIIE family protein phosphatase [Streptomyces sp. NL15-2K]|uniref:SpoIIE family protein phosphatase n=1 Tax=Streptomyces sp. NL15-2K TaxID=376149 RepID=UPI000F57FDA6|nr:MULTISPECIES: SpoIIE family protein phosphatase [Actinomycetes]WKX10931.1 SpoIIE family protein phosphatase [Kutzneria buriramensis]GCB47503.1 serine phosphatase rsbU [Streptomyces sp. NL15-2K]